MVGTADKGASGDDVCGRCQAVQLGYEVVDFGVEASQVTF